LILFNAIFVFVSLLSSVCIYTVSHKNGTLLLLQFIIAITLSIANHHALFIIFGTYVLQEICKKEIYS